MASIKCRYCGQEIDLIATLAECPHCKKDIAEDVEATIALQDDVDDLKSSLDTAKTAIAATAQVPGFTMDPEDLDTIEPTDDVDEEPSGGTSRTIESAGKSPNLSDYSATLKPTDSAFETADLSSAIPPRDISKTERPGHSQDYLIRKELGKGSFGVVYRALQVPLERTVAVKMLKSKSKMDETLSAETKARIKSQRIKDRNEFLREAQFTGKLEHPNIVPVHDIGLVKGKDGTGNRPFYVMKEIKGDPWSKRLKDSSRIENLEILRKVTDAIGFAHDKNIIHNDLKPENVMLGEFGEVLVVDWGGAIDLARRETYRPYGSAAYISPEMATYWCDIFLDRKESSPAIRKIGKQSDVYVLGAILFEIITGQPPHFGKKGETAYDVMRRATRNEIRKHEKWMDDELMQIARRALRVDDTYAYESISQFQEALRAYETRRISIELRERAEELLAVAKETNDYDAYGKSRFGFEESIEKWEENEQSKTGLLDARLSCAGLALSDQNFDLGIGMLENPETQDEKVLRRKLIDGKNSRDRRKALVRMLSVGFALAVAGGIITALLLGNWAIQEQNKAEVAKADAVKAKDEADTANKEVAVARKTIDGLKDQEKELKDSQKQLADDLADKQKALADAAKNIQTQTKLATDATKLAADKSKEAEEKTKEAKAASELAKAEAERAKRETERAEKESQLAEEAKKKADAAQRLAKDAEERNVLLKHKDIVSQIRTSISDGNLQESRILLDGVPDEKKSAWEWGRLNMKSHPEAVEFLNQSSPVRFASATEDGTRVVFVEDNRVAVRDTNDFDRELFEIRMPGISAAALSPSGRELAVGVPGNLNQPGRIEIYRGNRRLVTLGAPSDSITDLKFSASGNRLLVVGKPNRIRKSSKLEKDLMLYEIQNGVWNPAAPVNLSIRRDNQDQRGSSPTFETAEFSEDGQRILICSQKENNVHVYDYDESEEEFVWINGTATNDVDVAIFADPQGSRVVGSRKKIAPELFIWNVNSSEGGTQFISSAEPDVAVARVNKPIRSLKRNGNILVTAGEDKEVGLWNLSSLERIQSIKGHSDAIDFCTVIRGATPESSVLLSVVTGDQPEVLRTDLSNFNKEIDVLALGDSPDDENSPVSIYQSSRSQAEAYGNASGLAVAKRNGEMIEWEVAAWQKHVVTDEYLFAQTRRDHFLKYNRKTGEIESVLRRLSQLESPVPLKIVKFQVSRDGRIALIETLPVNEEVEPAKEFQIWDLVNQTEIKRIRYDNVFNQMLPTVKLSPNGQFLIAGKVGFAVWSTQPGDDFPIFSRLGGDRGVQWPKLPLNNFVFCDGGNEFAVSWPESATEQESVRKTGRIHLYQRDGRNVQLAGRFRTSITQGIFDTNLRAYEPNTFDARVINDERFVLARTAEGIDVLQLKPGIADPVYESREWDAYEVIKSFPGAKFARFSDTKNDVLILNKSRFNPVQRWNLETDQFDSIELVKALEKQFPAFPSSNFDALMEDNLGLTVQSLVRNKKNVVQRIANTVTLNEQLKVDALRILSKPQVDYSAIFGDRAITVEAGNLRYWDLVQNQNDPNRAKWLVRPAGNRPGFYDLCAMSPDERQLLVKQQDGSVLVLNPENGDTLYEIVSDVPGAARVLSWSRDSQQFAIGFQNGEIRAFQNRDGKFEPVVSPRAGDSAVTTLVFAEDNDALLAVFASGNLARVYRKSVQETPDGVEIVRGWNSIAIGYADGRESIVVGDISNNGHRVITGTASGKLTIWNSETTNTDPDVVGVDSTAQVEQRELIELDDYHKTAIRFVKFFQNPENGNQTDIISAEVGGGNEIIVWKTNGS